MANLPEKNITTVSAMTSIPSNTNIFVNANGQFGQASINNVIKASNVVSDATLNAMKELIDNQFKVLTGSPILAQGTEDGYMPSFTGAGGSSQNSYGGYQLFDASKLPTTSKGGATVTNNGDGSFTVSGSGALTEAFGVYYNDADIIKSLKAGTLTLESTMTKPYIQISLISASGGYLATVSTETSNKSSISITEDMINNTAHLRYYIYGASGSTIVPGTFKPMLYQDGDGTFEPFTNAQPSPNPSYPQPIKSKGDMGWFDGELLSGYYRPSDGAYTSLSSYICSKNKVPCKENDVISLSYEEVVPQMNIVCFDSEGNFVSSNYKNSNNTMEITAPTNAKYFTFNINQSGITPSTAKKIVVTINGTYAVKVTSVGKNQFDESQLLRASGWTYSDGVYGGTIWELYKTFRDGFDLPKFLENTQYTISCYVKTDTLGNGARLRIHYTDGIMGELALDGSTSEYKYVKTTTLSGKNIEKIAFTFGDGGTLYIKNFQIEVGSATDYEPYKEHTEWIPLSEPLRGIGEVKDSAKKVDGLYVDSRKIYKDVLKQTTGTWNVPTTENSVNTTFYQCATKLPASKSRNIICTHFSAMDFDAIWRTDKECIGISTQSGVTYIRLRVNKDRITTNLKDWLNENVVEIMYELAQETFEPFTDQSPFYRLKTFEGVTHISATDDMEMVVEVPTSRAGGVASIGWSKGNLAQIETQNLSAKIAELQTAIVNS